MGNKFDIYFNSGLAGKQHYEPGDNVSLIEVSNSDQQYYQSGRVQLFNVPSSQNIGDTCMIYIDDISQFNGYVSRRQQTIEKGKKVWEYQLVGKTYDLWRYPTDANALYSGTTAYIASSLVAAYCPGISGNDIDCSKGFSLANDIDLTNMQVGDAIVKLTEIDGFKFFVDNDNELQYYVQTSLPNFSITESDFISMDPIEESDEDLVNDCLVIGGSDYSQITSVSPTHPQSKVFPANMMVAQRFNATEDRLSAIKLYLNRTIDPNAPGDILFEIWENTEMTLIEDDFDDWSYIDYSSNMTIEDGNLTLAYKESTQSCAYGYGQDFRGAGKWAAQTFKFPSYSGQVGEIRMLLDSAGGEYNWEFDIRPTGNSGKPSGVASIIVSGTYNTSLAAGAQWIYHKFNKGFLENDKTYALVVRGIDDYYLIHGHVTDEYANGKAYVSNDGETWSDSDLDDFSFYVKIRRYSSMGYISSTSYTNDTRYMKLDLEGVVSGNWIFISGTNNNWVAGEPSTQTIVSGQWYDFGCEKNTGTQIKYRFSSNGNFTPKISKAILTVSDETGGYEQTVFTEDFSDATKLSSNSLKNIKRAESWYNDINSNILTNCLVASGLKVRSVDASDDNVCTEELAGTTWTNSSNAFDGNSATDAYLYVPKYTTGDAYAKNMFKSTDTHTIVGAYIEYGGDSDTLCNHFYIQFSSNSNAWTGMFHDYQGTYCNYVAGEPDINEYVGFDGDCYYSGVRGTRCYWDNLKTAPNYETGSLRLYDIGKVVTMPKTGFSDGEAKSRLFDCGGIVYNQIKVIVSEHVPNAITYSGSLNAGSTWTKLTKNQWTSIASADSGSKLVVGYYIQASGNYKSTSGSLVVPNIRSVTVKVAGVEGGGVPKSGTKVEWSDDISFTAGDVPYPPSHSSWQTYTDLKLAPGLAQGISYPFKNNDWWMVFTPPDTSDNIEFEIVNEDFQIATGLGDWDSSSNTGASVIAYGGEEVMSLDAVGWIKKESVPVWDKTTSILVNVKLADEWSNVDVSWAPAGTENWTSFGCLFYAGWNQASLDVNDILDYSSIDIKLDRWQQGHNPEIVAASIYVASSLTTWSYYYNPDSTYDGKIAYSWDDGVNWSTASMAPLIIPRGNMTFKLGWKEGDIEYRASNQTSIDSFGRHFKKINEPSYTRLEQVQQRAEQEVSGMSSIPKKGTITINGRPNMSADYRFSSNLNNFGINELWDVTSYTQRIDRNGGFTTIINYGKQPFDIVRKVSEVAHNQETA